MTFLSDEDRIKSYLTCMRFNLFIRLNKHIKPLYLDLDHNWLSDIRRTDAELCEYVYDNSALFKKKYNMKYVGKYHNDREYCDKCEECKKIENIAKIDVMINLHKTKLLFTTYR